MIEETCTYELVAADGKPLLYFVISYAKLCCVSYRCLNNVFGYTGLSIQVLMQIHDTVTEYYVLIHCSGAGFHNKMNTMIS